MTEWEKEMLYAGPAPKSGLAPKTYRAIRYCLNCWSMAELNVPTDLRVEQWLFREKPVCSTCGRRMGAI